MDRQTFIVINSFVIKKKYFKYVSGMITCSTSAHGKVMGLMLNARPKPHHNYRC